MSNFTKSQEFLEILAALEVALQIFPHEIISIIALCAIGRILKCMNLVCQKEILILKEHDTLVLERDEFEINITKSFMRYDQQENKHFFYDKSIVACDKCVRYVSKCRGYQTHWSGIPNNHKRCDGWVYCEPYDHISMMRAYFSCLCDDLFPFCRDVDHMKCEDCGTVYCGDIVSDVREYNNCRFCLFCYRKGCYKCIKKVPYGHLLKNYIGPVHLCKRPCTTLLICNIL